MSISPTEGHRSVSFDPTLNLPRNRNTSHGRVSQGSRNHTRRPSGDRNVSHAPDRCLEVPPTEIVPDSGPTLGNREDLVGSSSSVTCGDSLSQTPEEALSSNSNFVGHGFTSSKGKQLGPCVSQNFDCLSARSIVPQGNIFQSGSKRNNSVNANHLLNFYYEPIPIPRPQARAPPRRQRKIKPFNRDLFLQANFKFIVLDRGNYLCESTDPDKMLQWDDVVCVRYSTPTPVQCPICLEAPLCPQITSCGHIYCFPCILQYLLLGEENNKREIWKKCPLCFMMLSTRNLYTVLIDSVLQLNVSDTADFTLLTRGKDSLFPSLKKCQGKDILWVDNDDLSDTFSKFIPTSDVELSVRQSKLDLSKWLEKADSGLVDDELEKLPYVSASLEVLEERRKNWTEHRNLSSSPIDYHISPTHPKVTHSKIIKIFSPPSNVGAISTSSCSDAKEQASFELGVDLTNESVSSDVLGTEDLFLPISATPSSERDFYTFYQATDGQYLILHPLNMKCLLHHYGSYDMLPSRISGRILEMETVTQSEAMRRRYRYLSHFSLTTTFTLCEIDLSDILPPDSLAPFMDEMKKRQKQRKKLAKKAEDERTRAEIAAALDVPIVSARCDSSTGDPIFTLDDFEALGTSSPSTSPPVVVSERKLFSSVARLGYASAHNSPSLAAERSTVSPGIPDGVSESSRAPVIEANTLSFATIMSSARGSESAAGPPSAAAAVGGYTRKGKKSTRVLLSTAGGRRY